MAAISLRRQFLAKQLATTSASADSDGLTERQRSNIKKNVTRYRRNWEIFAEEVFGIKLYPIQKITLHLMGISDVFFDIATRGAAKSFLCGLGALIALCLYPYSEIVITSSTIAQASKLVEKKIRDEIIKKLSPYLLEMYKFEYIVITKSNTNDGGAYCVENKLNGSTITVLPCLDSARGSRATWIILEETRFLKQNLVQSIFIPMGHARQAKYLVQDKYKTARWKEKPKVTYITSAGFSYEWFSRLYRETVVNYYASKKDVYIPFAEDIFAAINDGSRTWADYRLNRRTMTELSFRMEILNEMLGENKDAFFNYQSFKENQILKDSFRPLTSLQAIMGEDVKFTQKKDGELRLVVADFAFVGTTSNQKNDNTVILCMSLHWKNYRFERHVDYIEAFAGGDSLGAADRLKEIYWDYNADYLIYDTRNGGEVIFNYLTMNREHPERGKSWNPSGFGLCNEADLHVVTQARQEEFRSRTVDQNAIPCLIPMSGHREINSTMWIELRKNLETNNIKFLVDTQTRQDDIENDGSFYGMTSEQYAEDLLPYGQTDELISECVNLSAEYKDGIVRLSEPHGGYKDRAVCLSYGNHIACLLDTRYNKSMQQDDIDWDNIQLVF